MRIGIVCYPSIGGSGIVATNLGIELGKLGHEVHFISYEPPFRLNKKHKNIFFHQVNINEYSLFKYPDYTLPLAVAIEEVQKRYLLDVVHVHYAVPHATAALLARRILRQNGTPLPKIVTTLHGTDITLLARDPALFSIIKYSIERSHGVTAVSESLKRETMEVLKPSHDIEVIYNFYSPKKITKSRSAVRRALKIKDTDLVVIHSSNLRPVKRIADLLQIAGRIHDPRFKLLILSGGDFSPYQKLGKKLGKKLILLENILDIQNYINAADLGLYTSEAESFGMGILEAMVYGKPIVSTAAGGVPEVVDEGITGFLRPIGDIGGLEEKVNLLLRDEKLRQEMGKDAKQIACERFCSRKIVPQYLEYYKRVLKS